MKALTTIPLPVPPSALGSDGLGILAVATAVDASAATASSATADSQISGGSNVVALYDTSVETPSRAPLAILPGHEQRIDCLAFVDNAFSAPGASEVMLCTISEDRVLLWHVRFLDGAQVDSTCKDITLPVRDALDGTSLRIIVRHACFDANAHAIAFCIDECIAVVRISGDGIPMRFEGHIKHVAQSAFCRQSTHAHLLISASGDRTCKLWDTLRGEMVAETSVAASSHVAVSADPYYPRFAVASQKNVTIVIYAIVDALKRGMKHYALRELKSIFVGPAIARVIESPADGESGIISMVYTPTTSNMTSAIGAGSTARLIIATSMAIACVNPSNGESNVTVDPASASMRSFSNSAACGPVAGKTDLRCAVTALWDDQMHFFDFTCKDTVPNDDGNRLSMLATTPLPASSPLKRNVSEKENSSAKDKQSMKTTFNRRVKSSGYGASPPVTRLFCGTALAPENPDLAGKRRRRSVLLPSMLHTHATVVFWSVSRKSIP